MGYTHYWTITKPSTEQAQQFVSDVNEIIAATQVELRREYDRPGTAPEVTTSSIAFNGVDDDGHETFYIDLENGGGDFCKTAEKPYDEVVTAILIRAAITLGAEVRSDGYWNEWGPGRDLYTKVFGDAPDSILPR